MVHDKGRDTMTSRDMAVAPRAIRGPIEGRNERGEGVISTAIAVLIIAFLGVAMWAGFNSIFSDAAQTTRDQVQLIGR